MKTTHDALCDLFSKKFGLQGKFYGEAVQNNEGTFSSIKGSHICQQDNSYRIVAFYVRNNANPIEDNLGRGLAKNTQRRVSYTLVCYAESLALEPNLSSAIDSQMRMSYQGSSFDQTAIAQRYFNIEQPDFSRAFFTIDFNSIENLDCPLPC